MVNKINSILKEVCKEVEISKENLLIIEKSLKEFMKKLENIIKKNRIDAEIFIGGSFAKETMIKKEKYDVDIFLRFSKKYKSEEISNLTYKILKEFGKNKEIKIIHGSRDYFQIKIAENIFFEVIPVMKVKNPKGAENITDLSYFHVKYIKKKIKAKKILDDIRIAKVFCYANNYYGAESYIGGFSGYALELLICYYGSFLKFITGISKTDNKIIIDIEKHYKNKNEILMDLNSSKLQSPIILIDPTYKQRNALASLKEDTFKNFKKSCKNFLKNPSKNAFEIKRVNYNKIKENTKKKNSEFVLLEIKTGKQEGDVAGSKLLKFYNHLSKEINRFFKILNKGFEYRKGKKADCFFVVKSKKKIIQQGPNLNDKKNIKKFKERHKKTFIKSKKIYAEEKINFNLKDFLDSWKNENKKRIGEMSITDINFRI